jgi:hypothetical protein
MYQAAFRQTNSERGFFLGYLSLVPNSIPLWRVYSLTNDSFTGPTRYVAKCSDEKIIETDGARSYRSLSLLEKLFPNCTVRIAVGESVSALNLLFTSFAFVNDVLPFTPLFAASFFISILYYFCLWGTVAVFLLLRLARAIFVTKYIATSTRPFEIVSVLIFIAAVAAVLLIDLVIDGFYAMHHLVIKI